MKKIYTISSIFLLAMALFSCNDYLDEQPRKGNGIELKTFEQLEAIINARTENNDRQLNVDLNMAQLYMSDCFSLPAEWAPDVDWESILMGDYTLFHLNCLQPQYTDVLDGNSTVWLLSFRNIFIANTVLVYLDKVTGGTAEQRDILTQRAHFLRAFHYYELANCYCVPYCEANFQEPGVPINTDLTYKSSYSRASLKEVYEFIESELTQALDLSIPLKENGNRKAWRENSSAVNSFAARFYLTKGDYAKVQEYAEKALALNAELGNFNDETFLYKATSEVDGMTEATNWYNETYNNTTGLLTPELQKSYYKREFSHGTTWPSPSDSFLNSFDQTYDLRYKYFYYPDYSTMAVFGFAYAYGVPSTASGYSYYSDDIFESGPCTAEVILIKAEAMARQGKWNEALNYLNTQFRPYRISNDAPAEKKNLTAGNQQEAIALILKERMLEFPYTLRWHDIRRCNFNDDPNDDITIKRKFYELDPTNTHAPLYEGNIIEYTLGPNSNKYLYTMAIPASEVVISEGSIEQNRY